MRNITYYVLLVLLITFVSCTNKYEKRKEYWYDIKSSTFRSKPDSINDIDFLSQNLGKPVDTINLLIRWGGKKRTYNDFFDPTKSPKENDNSIEEFKKEVKKLYSTIDGRINRLLSTKKIKMNDRDLKLFKKDGLLGIHLDRVYLDQMYFPYDSDVITQFNRLIDKSNVCVGCVKNQFYEILSKYTKEYEENNYERELRYNEIINTRSKYIFEELKDKPESVYRISFSFGFDSYGNQYEDGKYPSNTKIELLKYIDTDDHFNVTKFNKHTGWFKPVGNPGINTCDCIKRNTERFSSKFCEEYRWNNYGEFWDSYTLNRPIPITIRDRLNSDFRNCQ